MAPTVVGRGMDIDVKTIPHYMAPLVLGLTFIASMATIGCAGRVGVYDPEYRDYHRWNRDEDRSYNDYWRERHEHEEYREYGRLNEDQQRDYWKWRHGRSDEGRGRDRDDRDRDDRDRR
jgi:hypothetical protein